jgi:Lambda phage tail tube protein, TTP
MSQNAVLTQGTQLKRGDGGSPEVFTAVPDVLSMSGPDASKAEIDVTDLASVAKEFKGGLADFGRLTVEMNYIPGNATHAAMRADFINTLSPVRNWQIAFTNGRRWDFSGYVASFPGQTAADSVQKSSMVIRLSGAVTEV